MSERKGESLPAGVLESPAAERNKQFILEVLERWLPPAGLVLEIASGTGQHIAHFAAALPNLTWQPSDPDLASLGNIRARLRAAPLANVQPPIELDVRSAPWPIDRADAIICINMIHIAPWTAAQALFASAGVLLAKGCYLILYGPFKQAGVLTAPSNEAFDASLRSRNAEWGLRDVDDVTALARQAGFARRALIAMPANNTVVAFQKT